MSDMGYLLLCACLIGSLINVAIGVNLIRKRKRDVAMTADSLLLLEALASQCPKCDSRDTEKPTATRAVMKCRRCGAKFDRYDVAIRTS